MKPQILDARAWIRKKRRKKRERGRGKGIERKG